MNEFQHSTNVAVFHLIKPAKKFYNFYWLSQTGSDMGKSTVTNSYQAAVNYSTPNEIPDKVLLSPLSLSLTHFLIGLGRMLMQNIHDIQ